VTETYYSPDFKVGDEFEAHTAEKHPEVSVGSTDFRIIIPALKVGDKALWQALKNDDGTINYFTTRDFNTSWPARTTDAEGYARAKQWAETIATLAAEETTAARIAKLKALLTSDLSPGIAGELLGFLSGHARKTQDAMLIDYIAGIPHDPMMPMSARTQADEAMLGLKPDEWRTSPARLKLLQSWMHNPPGRPDTGSIVAHLGLEAQRAVWPQEDFVGLVELAVRDKENTVSFKCFAVRSLYWVPKRYDTDVPAFEWLMKLLAETKEPQLQFTAARTLTDFPLDVSRQVRLEQAVNKLGNAEAKKHVDYILERLNRRPGPALVQ
jgi:hypothetical protein